VIGLPDWLTVMFNQGTKGHRRGLLNIHISSTDRKNSSPSTLCPGILGFQMFFITACHEHWAVLAKMALVYWDPKLENAEKLTLENRMKTSLG
jgi:hypothetical protein